jgi:terminase small subunit / prophage DNA-packing protein
MLLNRERLSDFLGCSLRTIDEYKRQGMPGDAPKKPGDQWRFDSGAVVNWLRERERTDALGEVARVDEAEAKRRKLAAEAALAEHELALKQGAAVAIADFEAAWAAMIGASRARLRGIGAKVGRTVAISLDPAECAALIDSAIDEALQELSEREPEVQFEPEHASEPQGGNAPVLEAVGAASGSDGKRVGRRGAAVKPGVQR